MVTESDFLDKIIPNVCGVTSIDPLVREDHVAEPVVPGSNMDLTR